MTIWSAQILTLFPEMFPGPLGLSLAGRGLKAGIWSLAAHDIRDYTVDVHRTVDDSPFGGGAGMVLRPDIIDQALAGLPDIGGPKIYLTPRGRLIDQELVQTISQGPGITLVCGRFEGLDQRVIDARDLLEVSLGDFVLSGGEPAAIALIDACVRLLPGIMGSHETLAEESFTNGLLEYPHYTRPQLWQDRPVPPVLLSGNHADIKAWRQAEAEAVTRARRPDLWTKYQARSGSP